jgi:hypothetical protein
MSRFAYETCKGFAGSFGLEKLRNPGRATEGRALPLSGRIPPFFKPCFNRLN